MKSKINRLPLRAGRKIYEILGLSRNSLYQNSPLGGILSASEGNRRIAEFIQAGKPAMISRFGSPECLAILNLFDVEASRSASQLARLHATIQGRWDKWQDRTKQMLHDNVGFFPITEQALERFARSYLSYIPALDMIGVWGFVPGESYLIEKFCPAAIRIDPVGLEPYFHQPPWSATLKGKRVLVIHPFSESIASQYRRRKDLFRDADILPDFELITLRAVQSLAGTPTPFKDWFAALDSMKARMDRLEFDVMIVGAGGYGLPLCAHAKSLGKVAVHMGGATQILFGIRGKRWDSMPHFADFFNEHWTRPLPSETIPSANKIEDGCYW